MFFGGITRKRVLQLSPPRLKMGAMLLSRPRSRLASKALAMASVERCDLFDRIGFIQSYPEQCSLGGRVLPQFHHFVHRAFRLFLLFALGPAL